MRRTNLFLLLGASLLLGACADPTGPAAMGTAPPPSATTKAAPPSTASLALASNGGSAGGGDRAATGRDTRHDPNQDSDHPRAHLFVSLDLDYAFSW
ncbi:MAG TPA: hypothetical protein VLV16_00015 [Gemmatimonadales bacterium]|nr:hypothetical protein [Gemmatimonadales bacterium]